MSTQFITLKNRDGSQSNMWINKDEMDKYNNFMNKQRKKAYHTGFGTASWYLDKRKERKDTRDNWKLAKIIVGNTEKIAWVDTIETTKAYKCGEWYSKTWMEIKNYTFVRWCTSFDM